MAVAASQAAAQEPSSNRARVSAVASDVLDALLVAEERGHSLLSFPSIVFLHGAQLLLLRDVLESRGRRDEAALPAAAVKATALDEKRSIVHGDQ